jgi:glycosyltransferase involved in cell wall biosynthesis
VTNQVSLIMPLFNGVGTVERAVRSVLMQTSSDWELIVVDDMSSDSGPEVVRRMMAEPGGERIQLITHRQNRGPSAARNTGLGAATGEFVGFVDCDDELLPGCLETMLGHFDDGTDIVIAAHVAQTSSGRRTARPDSLSGTFSGLHLSRAALEARLWNFLHAKLYRRSLVQTLRFPDDLVRYEDLVFNAIAYSFSRQVRIVPDPVYIYHVQSASLTWSQAPSLHFISKPLEEIQAGLNSAVRGQLGHRPWNTLRTFLAVLTYSGGLFAENSKEGNRDIARYIRSSLTPAQLLDAAIAAPHLGLSGLLIRVWPGLYAALYRWHARRTFGMAA